MPNDETGRGYELPHPKNIASSDVVRIRNAITAVDEDFETTWAYLKRQKLERTIGLWDEKS